MIKTSLRGITNLCFINTDVRGIILINLYICSNTSGLVYTLQRLCRRISPLVYVIYMGGK